jgi:hypothetical protein
VSSTTPAYAVNVRHGGGRHYFQGRLDRDCEICGQPDRHPAHVCIGEVLDPAGVQTSAQAALDRQALALGLIIQERARQDVTWGRQSLALQPVGEHGLACLVEEVGELAEAILKRDRAEIRSELVQVAAVATAMLEAWEREHGAIPGECGR